MKKISTKLLGLMAGTFLLVGCQTETTSTDGVPVKGATEERIVFETKGRDISLEEAIQIALKDAKLSEDQVKFDDKEFDSDDHLYEIEFIDGKSEYEYDIDSQTGEIVKVEKNAHSKADKKEIQPAKKESNKPKQTESKNKTQGKPQATPKKQTVIGMDKAKQIAFNHAGVKASNVHMDDVEYDKEDKMYELEFKSDGYEYEYDIHAFSGKILDVERDHDDDHQSRATYTAPKKTETKKQTQPKSSMISKDQAIAIALKHAGVSRSNAYIEEVEQDSEDGVRYYEIEFSVGQYEYEYEINAANGSILEHDVERDD